MSNKFIPCLNPEIKNMFRTRYKLIAAAIKSRSILLTEAHKQVRSRVSAMNSKLKKQYLTDKNHSCEGDLKETWPLLIC